MEKVLLLCVFGWSKWGKNVEWERGFVGAGELKWKLELKLELVISIT
jgi:hypothetical protein